MLGLSRRVFGATPAERDLFEFIRSKKGAFDLTLYRQLLGAANEYKEGDAAIGVAAADEAARQNARMLLGNTTIGDLMAQPVFEDAIYHYAQSAVDLAKQESIAGWTLSQLKAFLLTASGDDIHTVMPGLASDIIANVVKLMSNDELIAVARKIFNPLPGSQIGAQGYMGARIQPNSPTDHPDDIRWQVFNGFAYAVGDVVLGTNPVSSEVASVAAIEQALREILETFQLQEVMPHCVLAHIDVQAAVEKQFPGSTALWFQSLAGVDDAATVFDISAAKMRAYAQQRHGRYGLYFETGQGADATNGHSKGIDMVIHEARDYGFARALKRDVSAARGGVPAWVHLNDVAGFIGPEVFRTKEQLVRCCLEDTVMGKLHGLAIGLDICSTLHMEVDLDDLDWCIDRVMPANPAYLMALPTKNDPMLSYLTTAFQDHVRIREKFGYKVSDAMWAFFQQLGVIDADGKPTSHFGDPSWVYLQYCRRKGDNRSDADIRADAAQQIAVVRTRGVLIAEGHGAHTYDLAPALDKEVRYLYEDSRKCIRAELPDDFAKQLNATAVATLSANRSDYILHPTTGEALQPGGTRLLHALKAARNDEYDVQIVVSDGLNALAITDPGHLEPYLTAVRANLSKAGYSVAPGLIVVSHGRVRAGYRIGETLYGTARDPDKRYAILHVIGERPGSGHHAFSVYITAPPASTWARAGLADHNITKVVSGIADTQLLPSIAAVDTVTLLGEIMQG